MHVIFDNTTISSSLYTIKYYKKNDIVFETNEECTSVGFLESGGISIVTPTFSEKEYEINQINENGFFGAFVIFTNYPFYLGTGIATKNSKVIYFSKINLLNALKNTEFLKNYLYLTTTTTKNIQTKVKILSQKSIEEKIMFLLNDNFQQNKSKTLSLKSKLKLANYLNIPRPSLSRELIRLQNKGLITYDRYSITLKKD